MPGVDELPLEEAAERYSNFRISARALRLAASTGRIAARQDERGRWYVTPEAMGRWIADEAAHKRGPKPIEQ